MYSPFTEIPAAGNPVFVNEMNGQDEIGMLSPFANEDEGSSVFSFEDEDVLQTMEDDFLIEGEVNYAKAKEWNHKYSQELRWNLFDVEIYKLLGYAYTSPSEDELADAVAAWQRKSGIGVDGMIGPGTWSAMLQEIIASTSFAHVSIPTAIPANQKLKKILGWEKFQSAIYKVLGFHNVSPGEEAFAKAIALWQPKLGFKTPDGRLGEKTWAAIRTYVLSEVEKERQSAVIPEMPTFYPAIIKAERGIYLHSKPADFAKQTDVLYRRGELAFVIATSVISTESGWVKITTQDKRTGWIQAAHLVRMTIEELGSPLIKRPPGAYLVNPGDKLDILVQRFYPDYEIEVGNDRRTIVHAFSILNRDNDGVYYDGTSTTWWRNHVLDRDMEKTRTIYETIRLRENRLVFFPTEAYIKWLRDEKLVGVRPDWKNTAIEVGKSIYGFLKGVEEGFKEAGIDTIKGLWDFIKDLFTGELFRQIYDLYKEFSKYTVTEALSNICDRINGLNYSSAKRYVVI